MKKFSSVIIFLILALCLFHIFKQRWKGYDGQRWKDTIQSDGYGYYAYLPCIFIYHKFDYDRVLKEEQKARPAAYSPTSIVFDNKTVDKYFPGVAILLLPFFLIAYLLSYLSGYGTGGYEFLFQASVSIGALFYLAVALVYLRKLLKEFAISEVITGFVLLFIVFGTNLYYYAVIEPSMSHVYSFALMAAFFFFTKKYLDDYKFKNLAFMVILLSMLILIRPTNLLSLAFIPFIAGSSKAASRFIVDFFQHKKNYILLLIPAGFLLVLFSLWYLQTGHFFVWSYPGESFNFRKPRIFNILFSYRKGWFVYTPLMFIATFGGLIVLFRQNRFRFFNALFFFLVVTYILSSWWSWWYGGSFGLRAYIDFYSAFALLLAICLNSLGSLSFKLAGILLCFLCVGLNLFQTWQYYGAILPYEDMNKEKYWKIFLKNDRSYVGIFDNPDTVGFSSSGFPGSLNNFEENTWGHDQNITSAYFRSGTHSAFVNDKFQFSPTFLLKASEIPNIHPLFIFVKLWVYMPDFNNDASLVVSVKPSNGDSYYWKSRNLQGFAFHKNEWQQAYTVYELPAFKDSLDQLQVYVYNTKGIVYIDDMSVTFEKPK